MLLSVLSALARMDIDPWEEAAKLARLPVEAATRTLASLIAALPGGAAAHSDPETIATRLIALLPRQAALDVRPSGTLAATGAVAHFPFITYVIFCLIFTAFVLIGQWLGAGAQPVAQVAPTVTSRAVLPESSVPSSGETAK